MPTYDAETLRQTALDVRARNASAKRGHPKYTASLTSEQEMILTEGAIDALDALLAATQEVERLTREAEAMAPLRSLLDDWRWSDIDQYDIQDADLARRIVEALVAAERNLATIRHAAGVEGKGE